MLLLLMMIIIIRKAKLFAHLHYSICRALGIEMNDKWYTHTHTHTDTHTHTHTYTDKKVEANKTTKG
jgi:hypothetical protein